MNEFETPEYSEEVVMRTIVLRGLTLLPNTRATFEIGRARSINALRASISDDKKIFLVSQKDVFLVEPTKDDIAKTGVVAFIESCKKLSGGNYQIVVFCDTRAEVSNYTVEKEITYCTVKNVNIPEISPADEELGLKKIWSFVDSFLSAAQLDQYDGMANARKMTSLGATVDYLASNLLQHPEKKQNILDEKSPLARSELFMSLFMSEMASAELEKEFFSKTVALMKEAEREHFLREQLKVIRSELGEFEGEATSDDDDYVSKVSKASLPEDIREKLLKEASKLRKLPYGSMESSVLTTYLDLCLELPWTTASRDTLDIERARKILDEQHTGMEKVKERIIEYLSVKLLKKEPLGQILCFVGAPGVGKTSIASSIAEAMERKYVRVSLGGVRDEAEIRGHRKTYVGAMPGRIITAIKNAGVKNPLILLDEIDKLTADAHGDPTSALLEVLDGEQNKTFRDHFVELPFDLSNCFFIATANTLSTVPKPLLDRMEVIELESYTPIEKLAIAKNHLVEKQIKRHGLKKTQVKFTDDAINKIIDSYTREAGVRNLEREIASVCRKCAKLIVSGAKKRITVTPKTVVELLGPEKITDELIYDKDSIGSVNGLAWTSVGGELLRIEAISMEGTGKVDLTGSLGDVMKESARTAVSYIRKHSAEYGVDSSFYAKKDIHVHFPEGAVPKDGPSAGIAITTAILSELSGKNVKRDIAMTGEITLTGRVLAIGGLKEKTMAAYKAGVKTVILPKANEKDILKLDDFIKEKLEFKYVSDFSEVASLAFAN